MRLLKEEIEKGLADIEAGRVHEWDFDDFLRRVSLSKQNVDGRDKSTTGPAEGRTRLPGHDD